MTRIQLSRGPLILVLTTVSCEATRYHQILEDNYVLEAETVCNPTPTGDIEVVVVTDLNVVIKVTCKNNFTEVIPSPDHIHFYFYPLFAGDASSECVLAKMEGSQVYTLLITAVWGEPMTEIRPVQETLLVTCSYDDQSDNKTNIENISDTLIAPREIQHHKGEETSSNITLRMVDVLGDDITGKIRRGKLVKIRARSDGAGGELGLSASSCDGVSDEGVRYAVLRAGCGDGIIFGRSEGFITRGLELSSPFFSAFNLKGSNTMKFHCNFTLCSGNCDGSSCRIDIGIDKRSADRKNVTLDTELDNNELYMSAEELQVNYIPFNRPDEAGMPWWYAGLLVLMLTAMFSALAATTLLWRRRLVGPPMV